MTARSTCWTCPPSPEASSSTPVEIYLPDEPGVDSRAIGIGCRGATAIRLRDPDPLCRAATLCTGTSARGTARCGAGTRQARAGGAGARGCRRSGAARCLACGRSASDGSQAHQQDRPASDTRPADPARPLAHARPSSTTDCTRQAAEADRTVVYLISDRPFAASLR